MTYHSRRGGTNVSQYLRDLNHVSPQERHTDDSFNMEEDLALFTNTQFFDFDSGQNTDYQAQPVKVDGEAANTTTPAESVSAASVMGDIPNLDFIGGEFNFTDFSNYPTPSISGFPDSSAQGFHPLTPSHGPVYGNHVPQQSHGQYGSRQGDKRKQDVATPASRDMSFDEPPRQGVEEDKRRRNTAASARFRIKKKQREQALEKSAKDMTDKVTSLESKVSQLETENKWLKNLLVEKNEGNEDISALWKEFTKHASEKVRVTGSFSKDAGKHDR